MAIAVDQVIGTTIWGSAREQGPVRIVAMLVWHELLYAWIAIYSPPLAIAACLKIRFTRDAIR